MLVIFNVNTPHPHISNRNCVSFQPSQLNQLVHKMIHCFESRLADETLLFFFFFFFYLLLFIFFLLLFFFLIFFLFYFFYIN